MKFGESCGFCGRDPVDLPRNDIGEMWLPLQHAALPYIKHDIEKRIKNLYQSEQARRW